MNTKTKRLKVRLNLQMDKETREICNILRKKYHINISSLCRDAIINEYNKFLSIGVNGENNE